MRDNTDILYMENLIKEIKNMLKEPFCYHNISQKLKELLDILENQEPEVILKYMDDIKFISNMVLEIKDMIDGFILQTVNIIKEKGFSVRA